MKSKSPDLDTLRKEAKAQYKQNYGPSSELSKLLSFTGKILVNLILIAAIVYPVERKLKAKYPNFEPALMQSAKLVTNSFSAAYTGKDKTHKSKIASVR